MVPDAGHVAAALAGAFRLMRFDSSGFRFFDATMDGFWKSFFSAVLILPGYMLLVALRLDDSELANPLLRIVAVELIGYVIGWTAFPLVMAYLAQAFDLRRLYPGYIVAYNWFAAPQMALLLAAALLRNSGMLSQALESGLGIGVMLYILAAQWFIARRALGAHPAAALGIVLLDTMLSFLIAIVTSALLARGGAG